MGNTVNEYPNFDIRNKLYEENLQILSDIKFTIREIDVLACIAVASRSNQCISDILDISTPTVASHVFNIRTKLGNIPKNGLINFVIKTGKYNIFSKYYNILLLEKHFNEIINKITDSGRNNSICQFVYNDINQNQLEFLKSLRTKLESCGFIFDKNPESKKISVITKKGQEKLDYKSLTIYLDGEEDIGKIGVIDFTSQQELYISTLELIAQLVSDVDLKAEVTEYIAEFRQVKTSLDNIAETYDQNVLVKNRVNWKLYVGIAAAILSLIIIATFIYFYLQPKERKLGSNLIYPKPDYYISRLDYSAQLSNAIKKNKHVIITGLPGSGKTFAVRQYSSQMSCDTPIRWFEASSLDKIFEGLLLLAEDLGISTDNCQRKLMTQKIYKKIEALNYKIIFVFDSLQRQEDIMPFIINLPSNVEVIVTTSNHNLEINDQFCQIYAKPFSFVEAKEYCKHFLSKKYQAKNDLDYKCSRLVNKVGPLPYNLSVAMNYLMKKNKFINIDEFINKNERLNIDDILLKKIHPDSVAMNILIYSSLISKDFIDVLVLKKLLKLDTAQLSSALETLDNQSLIIHNNNHGDENIKIHLVLLEKILGIVNLNPRKKHEILEKITDGFNEMLDKLERKHIGRRLEVYRDLLPDIGSLINNNNYATLKIARLAARLKKIYQKEVNNYDLAIKWAKKTIYLIEKIEKTQKLSSEFINLKLDMLKMLSLQSCNLCNRKLALSSAKNFLNETQKYYAHDKNSIFFAEAYNTLGIINQRLGKNADALDYFLKASNICEKLSPQEYELEKAEYFHNLSQAYYEEHEIHKGLHYSKATYNILKNRDHSAEMGINSAINLSYGFYKVGYLDQCFKYASKALEMAKITYSENNHPSLADAYSIMGLSYYALGDWRKSYVHFEKAAEIYKKQAVHKRSIAYVRILNNLGMLSLKIGKIAPSLDIFNEALNVTNEIFKDENNKDAADIQGNLSDAYCQLGDFENALRFAYKSRFVTDIKATKYLNKYTKSLIRLGNAHLGLKNYQDALDYFNKALKVQSSLANPHKNRNMAKSFVNLANLHIAIGDQDMAKEYLIRSYKMLKEIYPSSHDEVIDILKNLQKMHINNPDEAVKRTYLDNFRIFTKQELYVKVRLSKYLKKIRNLSKKGRWSRKFIFSRGVEEMTSEDNIRFELAEMYNPQNMQIVQTLIIETMCVAFLSQNEEDRNSECLINYINQNKKLVQDLIKNGSEIFIDKSIYKLVTERLENTFEVDE